MDDIVVSVLLMTYNKKKYIKEAIDSILSQKTDFKYELIIRDDASTDGTDLIIKEYQKKYPDIIKPIFMKKNNFNKNTRLIKETLGYSKGKYIAFMDGDDYWIDDNKLQKQVNYMEEHLDCVALCTNYKVYNDVTKRFKKKKSKEKDYSVDEIISGDGGMFSSASIMARRSATKPSGDFYYVSPFEDYVSMINIALQGKVHLLKDYTSVYRINATESWHDKISKYDPIEFHKYMYDEMSKLFIAFNKDTNNKYKQATDYVLLKREFMIYVFDRNYKKIKDKKFKKLYETGSLSTRFLFFFKIHFCEVYMLLRILKRKINKC